MYLTSLPMPVRPHANTLHRAMSVESDASAGPTSTDGNKSKHLYSRVLRQTSDGDDRDVIAHRSMRCRRIPRDDAFLVCGQSVGIQQRYEVE